MNKLNVFLLNEFAGELWVNKSGNFEFQYDKNYLKKNNVIPLSISMPLTDSPLSGIAVKSFFSNLLPEGELKAAIAREKKISENNDFMMLKAIGGECAGAVSILDQGLNPETENRYDLLSEKDLEKILDDSKLKPVLITRDELRLSLAGAQNKIPLFYDGNNFYLPGQNSPSSHILKLESPSFHGLIENEIFCMQLAKKVGIDVPDVFIKKVGKHKAFIIERYDRIFSDKGCIERIHQEDFCQIAGIYPNLKYENESGPGLKECAAIIRKNCSVPVSDIKKYIQWIIFNYIIGNCDAHAKNISVLYSGGIKLAPFYDLISTTAFPELSKKLAMYIGGQKKIDYVMKHHWEKLAKSIGVKHSYLQSVIKDISAVTKVESDKLVEKFSHEYNLKKTSQKINKIIIKQIKRLDTI